METNVYNVIWADDEVDIFYRDENVQRTFNKYGIKILDIAHTSAELREKLSDWEDKVDAVITDGNYDKRKTSDIEESRTTSGLVDTISLISEFNRKRIIPFFLYTGKGKMLQEKFTDGELEYFDKRDRIIKKGNIKELLEKIIHDVNEINSPTFRIRNKYALEFEAASLIEEATENLERGLLYLYEDDAWKNTQDYFNPARKIVERIKASCIQMNLLPPHISLNVMSKLFSGIGKDSGYWLKEPLMKKPLAESLHFFLKITQDGSHDEDDLSLNVDQYVRETKNINLYRTILYIAMDLLLWHKRMNEKYSDNHERLWDSNFIYEGRVCKHSSRNFFYTGAYQLETKDVSINDGDWIGILKGDENKRPIGEIKSFVYKNNYIILEKAESNFKLRRKPAQ